MASTCDRDPQIATEAIAPLALDIDGSSDAPTCESECLELSERGTRFVSGSRFAIGTQLRLALVHMHPRLGMCRLALEGIVVWCEPCANSDNSDRSGAPCFECTLLFLEIPDDLRPALRDFSHRLATR